MFKKAQPYRDFGNRRMSLSRFFVFFEGIYIIPDKILKKDII